MSSASSRRRRPIYVESRIQASIHEVWEATQDPDLHQRWDLRFGSIDYLPLAEGEPQRFTYATTVVPGVTIAGTGESLGERDRPDGTRWSGLKFWAADRRSIIESGAGYWRYIPDGDAVRFLTRFDYRPRWGRFGEMTDRWLFRPLFGWATAWSFDRLRLWLEEGIPPARSRDLAVAHAVAVGGLTGVFVYQGLVPKLWKADQTEVSIWEGLGVPPRTARGLVRVVGALEATFAVVTATAAHKRWPFIVSLAAMPTLAAGAARSDRTILSKAFNPGSLGIAVGALTIVALVTSDGRPSGLRALREPPDRQPSVGDLP